MIYWQFGQFVRYAHAMSLMNETNASCSQFPQDDYKIIAAVRAATGPVTIGLSIVAILINVLHNKYRFQFYLIVLYMGVGALFGGISTSLGRLDYIIQPNSATTAVCAAMGFLDTYSLWVIVLSTASLAFSIYIDFIRDRMGGSKRRQLRFWFLLIFVGPLLFLWIPFIRAAYGRSPNLPWCTIRTMTDQCDSFVFGRSFNAIMFTVIFILAIVVLAFYSLVVIALIRRRRRWNPNPDGVKVDRQLSRTAIAFFFLLFAFMASVIINLTNAIIIGLNRYSFALWIAVGAFNPTAVVVLLLTVDRTVGQVQMIRGFRNRVSLYKVKSVMEAENVSCSYCRV